MGPRPAVAIAASGSTPSLSTSRRALLATLRSQPGPVTLTALGAATGLHVNTVREHLAALTDAGLVTRGRAAPHGRGRPAATYTASTDPATGSEPAPVSAEYAGLAAALASTIHRTSSSPSHDATVAGTEWGRELARNRPGPPPADDVDPRGRVVQLLADLGFAPRPADGPPAVLLTRCPLLETAHAYPDVVCAVHLGIVRGALGEFGADPAGAELHPFSDPGACRLDLARTDRVPR
ncbi:winged helix-turn-helix transcriptional regulator [Pengzhenrongella frigida]|uniref:Winged helix-turn-helix transcriptional regulator n=2 Tax=Pengzhenrongella frigida TaxID=1259133 RepID=A0A4Q5N7E2_9MICO|nr:winged helix-turn-helix transcriptional regulator [Cellulomonas sp. HLT2-17]